MEDTDIAMTDTSQIINFEDPEINIPLPNPLSKHLMKGLNLTSTQFPKPIPQFFQRRSDINTSGRKVPADRSRAKSCLEYEYSWVEITCNGGLTIWWRPSSNLVRYEMPSKLRQRDAVAGARDKMWYEVKGYGGVSKCYHRHSKRILPPLPILESGDVTFQMFSMMLATCP